MQGIVYSDLSRGVVRVYVLFRDVLGEGQDFIVYMDRFTEEKEKALVEMYYRNLVDGLIMGVGKDDDEIVQKKSVGEIMEVIRGRVGTEREEYLMSKVKGSEIFEKIE